MHVPPRLLSIHVRILVGVKWLWPGNMAGNSSITMMPRSADPEFVTAVIHGHDVSSLKETDYALPGSHRTWRLNIHCELLSVSRLFPWSFFNGPRQPALST